MKLYGIYDVKAQAFVGRLMLLPADGAAARLFEDAKSDQSSEIGKYPDDFHLFRLGSFDEFTGELTPEKYKVTDA